MKKILMASLLLMSSLAFADEYKVGAVFVDGQVREVQLLKQNDSGSTTEETSIKLKGTLSKEDMDQVWRIFNGGVESITTRSLVK